MKEIQKKHGLKRIGYEDIKKSNIYFNILNCRAFIRGNAFKNSLNINIKIQSIKLNVVENRFDSALIEDGFKIPPKVFYPLKSKYISRYYKCVFEESPYPEKTVLLLEVSKFHFVKTRI